MRVLAGRPASAYLRLDKPDDAANVLEDGLNTYPQSGPIAEQLVSVLTGLHRDAEAALVRELAPSAQTAGGKSGR